MKNRTIVGLLLVCCAWGAGASAAQPAPSSLRPRMPARQGDAAAVCAAEARRQRPARRRHAARDRRCRREAAREGRPRRHGDAAARLPPGHHRRARRRGGRPCRGGGERSARDAGGAAEGGRRQADRNRAGGHTQPRGRAHLQHRRPERVERGDELRAASRAARSPATTRSKRRCTTRKGSMPRRPSPP